MVDKIRYISETKLMQVSELQDYDGNARTHSEEQIQELMESIRRFGMNTPLAINEKNILIYGHGRLEAAKRLGMTQVPVVLLDHLTDAERIAYTLADNRIAENAGWDNVKLSEELGKLSDLDFDLDCLGLSDEELLDLLPEDDDENKGNGDGDSVPDIEQNIHDVKLGDMFSLGNHRLLCGDSTDKAQVDRLMGGEKADMVFTDPPYGVKAVGNNGKIGGDNLAKNGVYSEIIGDETTDTARKCYLLSIDLCIDTLVFWGGNYYSEFCPSNSGWIVWDKRGLMASNNFADCELAWTNTNKPARVYKQIWSGMIKEGESGKRVHPTQKPILLAEWCFNNYGNPKIVIDFFLGSGSTLIACEKTNRKCFGMELSEEYCSVIIERWQEFTGKKARRV